MYEHPHYKENTDFGIFQRDFVSDRNLLEVCPNMNVAFHRLDTFYPNYTNAYVDYVEHDDLDFLR